MQTAYRRHVQQTAYVKTLSMFPERTKAALLVRALQEKKRADALHDTFHKFISALQREVSGLIDKHLEAVPFEMRYVYGPRGLALITERDHVEAEEEDMGFDLFG